MCNEFLSSAGIILFILLGTGLIIGLLYFIGFLLDLKDKVKYLKYEIDNNVLHVNGDTINKVENKLNSLNNTIESLKLYKVKLDKRSKK